MSFDAGSIIGRLLLDKTGFASGMVEAEGLTHLLGGSISTFLANPMLGVATFAKEGVTAIAELTTHTAEAAAEMGRLADRTGASVEFVSGLKYAAEMTHVSFDEVSQSMAILSRNSADAAKGMGPAALAFQELGVSATDASGKLKNGDQLMLDVADGLSRVDSATERTALSMDIFGRGAAGLGPLLKGGSAGITDMIGEAKKLGLTFDEASAAAGERFSQAITRVKGSFEGLAMKTVIPIFESLAPVLEQLADSLGSVLGPILEQVGKNLSAMAPMIGDLVLQLGKALIPVMQACGEIFEALRPALEPILGLIGSLANLISSLLVPVLQMLTPVIRIVAEIVGLLASGIKTVVDGIRWLVGGADPWSASGKHPFASGSTHVNVLVNPEDSADRVARKVAPAISGAVHGVQGKLEIATQRKIETENYQKMLAWR